MLLILALVSFCRQDNLPRERGINLLTNPALTQEWTGWTKVWTREGETATTQIVEGRKPSTRSISINYSGEKDWALSQVPALSVVPGEIYQISAWMKLNGGNVQISTVARDDSGQTINWQLGPAESKSSGWYWVKRNFVVPSSCRTLQFRIVGTGTGKVWVESPSLVRIGLRRNPGGFPITLSGANVDLQIASDGSMTAKTHGISWRFRQWGDDIQVLSLKRSSARSAEITALYLADDLPLKIQIQVDPSSPEATIRCQGKGAMTQNLGLPGSVITAPGQWLVLPMNEGIRFPVEDKTIDGWSLVTYGGHGLCMPWSGVTDPRTGAGTLSLLETPNDADFTYTSINGSLSYQPRWEPSRQSFGEDRKLRLCFFTHGGFVAMAKRYRAYAKASELYKSLAQKRRENPNVDRLIGAVNIWNWDMDKFSLCSEMKKLGFDHVLWSSGGSPSEIRQIASLGYLPGRYDIYQDVWDPKNSLSWQNTIGWPEDLVLDSNGDWLKGWAHPDKQPDGSIKWYQGGVICSTPGLARAKQQIPADLAKTPYLARFIDTTTASPFRECFNPAHPLTRGEDRANKMALLDFCSKDMRQVVGTETGIDPSVPVVDYYEGMMSLGPFRLPDAGTFMMEYRKPTPEFLKFQIGATYRIPLWELVYHDCTVAQWYWGDATNKAPEVWDQRDLLNILYGTAPLLMFDKARWDRDKARMVQTYRNVCTWTRKIGYDEMVSHEDLTPDHMVQKTVWSSGRSAIVNFGSTEYRGIPSMGFRLTP